MTTYFATLSGDIQFEEWIRFEAENDRQAQEIADNYAEEAYSAYGDPFDEDDDDSPLFYATVEKWNDEKHNKYLTEPCFTDKL